MFAGGRPCYAAAMSLYDRYRSLVRAERLPVALIDLDAIDRNIETLLAPVRATGKSLRLASKSVRCVALMRYILERGAPTIRGIMGFTAAEAAFLVEHGFDDVLLAYPTANTADTKLIAETNAAGATVSVVVDDERHLDALSAAGKEAGCEIPVIVEADMSYRPLGGRVHLGALRSPVRTVGRVVELAERAETDANLSFHGIMGYESQIAGLQDSNPFEPLMNGPKRLLKRLSRGPVESFRQAIADTLAQRGLTYEVFNGGGTGSLNWCADEKVLTEATAGSGFLDSHLFDYYAHLTLAPAVFFAVQVVRVPSDGVVTCHGGGYVASGSVSKDKLPRPFLPEGLDLLDLEGAGEVQTPVTVPAGVELGIGDPVFFRHAKAGELAERFSEYLFVRGDEIVERVPTYRGHGGCFL